MAQLIKGKQLAAQTVTINSTTGNVIAEGDLDMNANQVIISEAPTLDTHAANKAYVDSVAAGLDPKESVRMASTENIIKSKPESINFSETSWVRSNPFV